MLLPSIQTQIESFELKYRIAIQAYADSLDTRRLDDVFGVFRQFGVFDCDILHVQGQVYIILILHPEVYEFNVQLHVQKEAPSHRFQILSRD